MENSVIHSNQVKYLIIQAGGRGTRMERFTQNKPKCLVPLRGRPIIENTFEVFGNCKIIVIGDYLYEVLERYLKTYCSGYNYILIRTNQNGTAAGLDQALSLIPSDEPFALTWSDLFFEQLPEYSFSGQLAVAVTNQFRCRWKFDHSGFQNENTYKNGIAGFYVFRDKSGFENLNTDLSLVRGFLQQQYRLDQIESFELINCLEIGEAEPYTKMITPNRFFNTVEILQDRVVKTCNNPDYQHLIREEICWYDYLSESGIRIPKILNRDPLVLERIHGEHAYNVIDHRDVIIKNYCDSLYQLHDLGSIDANSLDCWDFYYEKPLQRLRSVAPVVPDLFNPELLINGQWCKNPICDLANFRKKAQSCVPESFTVIHGDCTFSNTLIDHHNQVWFIDPRGRFGSSEMFGDPQYDWAKLYYSVVGNYDSINQKQFCVNFNGSTVDLVIRSNGYEQYSDYIRERSGMTNETMTFLQCNLWLSLTGYVREDIDAVLYAFYNGVYLWNQL